ncbi:hypothetical protein DAI22_03g131032 [Oryza sativa Japonica Group]|nr:hypothetical protein DAI22_03g131032 [Oryza sativa Japonica Group]
MTLGPTRQPLLLSPSSSSVGPLPVQVIGDGGDAVIGDGGGGLQRLPRRRPWSRGGGRAAPESTPPAKYARGRRPRRGSGGHAPHPESGGGGGGGGGAREWRDVGTTMRGGGGRGRGKSAQAADRCCRRMPMDGGPPTPTLAEVLSLSPPTTPRSRAPSSSRRRRMAAQTLATTAAGGQTAAEVARPPDSTPPAESGEEGGVGVHTGEEGKAAAAGEGSDPFFPIIAAPSLPSPTQPPLLLPRHRGALLVTEEIGRRRRCRWEAATARDGDGAVRRWRRRLICAGRERERERGEIWGGGATWGPWLAANLARQAGWPNLA